MIREPGPAPPATSAAAQRAMRAERRALEEQSARARERSDLSTRVSFERPTARAVVHEWLLGLALAVLCLAAVVFLDPLIAGGLLLALAAVLVWRRRIFRWSTGLFLLAAVIMFIPIRRFALPVPLPFALEPYRMMIAALLVALAIAVLAGKLRSWRPVVWSWSIAIFLLALWISVMANAVPLTVAGLVEGGIGNVVQFAFLLSVMLTARQLIRSERTADQLICFLVAAGAVVGFVAVVERFTGTNYFLVLGDTLGLQSLRDPSESLRAGGGRSYASSQHPIALAVLFCMLLPVTVYHAWYGNWPRNRISRILLSVVAIGCLGLGMLAAVSRTGVVVIGVMTLVVLLLRPRIGLMVVVAAIPLLALAAALLPSLFESMFLAFFDLESLIASQYTSVGMAGQGRLADLGPAMADFLAHPFFGTGVGSRIVVGDFANADILDNQALGILLEAGVVGIIGLIALLVYPAVRMLVFSMRTSVPPKLAAMVFAIGISTVGYIAAMFLYDAFSFMQTLLVLSLLYAVAAWAMTDGVTEYALRAREQSAVERVDPADPAAGRTTLPAAAR